MIALYFYRVKFCFKADVDGLMLTLTAERIYRSQQSERFKITITGTDSVIIIQNNRPLVEAKKSGKTVQWHIVEGNADNKTNLADVYKQLEKNNDKQPAVIQGTLNFITHF